MTKCRNIVWNLILGATFLMGCGKEIPKGIIPPDKMESILYDYHLSISMSNTLNYSDNYQKEAYKHYIFDKHHISEAEFDSSMVWYTRHTEELALIYKQLGVRFRNEKIHVENMLALRENKMAVSLPGDTVNVWHSHDLLWLTETPLANSMSFEIQADSNFKAKDGFLWSVDYAFLSADCQKAVMGFNILFENDSVIGGLRHVDHSGKQMLYLKSDSAFTIKSLNGFIYYVNNDSMPAPGVIVSNISLIRYHEQVTDTVSITPSDTLNLAVQKDIDSLRSDTLSVQKADSLPTDKVINPVRMNPREMKENNADRPQRIKRRN